MVVSTTVQLAAELGEQLRALRLRQNVDQQQLAARAGVALNAVKNLESGKGATVGSLLKVLRLFVRSLVGLDREAAKEAMAGFLAGTSRRSRTLPRAGPMVCLPPGRWTS